MALLMVTLVKEHGLQYLLAATLLCGVLQILAGYLKLGSLMRFVSRSVVTGFVNALAILIFMAQLPELTNVTWHVYAMTAASLGIIYLFPYVPKIGKLIPSPLVCILTLTAIAIYLGLDIRTVGDMGQLPDTLPIFLWPEVPLNLETLRIIFPYSAVLAVVGLLESMMTATIVDDLTDTTSNKNRECKGQGVANIAAGMLGGMAGCAMIGQEKAAPLVKALHDWMLTQRDLVLNGSATAKALDYSLKRWIALTRYLEDGAIPIDNNPVENQIRPWGAWTLELGCLPGRFAAVNGRRRS